MKAYRGVDVEPHFLDLGTSWRWSVSRPCCFTPGERAPGTHRIGGWAGPRDGLDNVNRKSLTLQGLELRPLGRPARSQSLYRLRFTKPQYKYRASIYQTESVIEGNRSQISQEMFQSPRYLLVVSVSLSLYCGTWTRRILISAYLQLTAIRILQQ
jgi:hypothetical protein